KKISTTFIINLIFIFLGTVIISVFSQISFYLPFNKEIPYTFQTFAVLLNGAVQSPLNSCLSCIIYLIVGCIGVPIFAGFSHAVVFFIGFIVASPVTGYLSKRGWDKQYRKIWLSMIIANTIIYIFGFAWYYYKTKEFWGAFPKVVFPFIPGDLMKILLASICVPLGWKIFYFRKKEIDLDIENHE
ncbi:hypothetical protein PIROE2DRAFT_9062, partial [Piromyces sp. E2]